MVVLWNYLAGICLMYLFAHLLTLPYLLVRVGSIGLLFLGNFYLYRRWVFATQ